jgi:two-component system, NarL family, nitrate/nitrite response regulator NarL
MNDLDIRVALVEDHTLLAESLLIALAKEHVWATVVPVGDGTAEPGTLTGDVLATDPAVVVLDLDLGPAGDGVALIDPLVRNGPAVVVVTATDDPARWGECLAKGAHAVVGKTARLEDIVTTVRMAARGEPVLTPTERADLVERWRRRRSLQHGHHERLDRLTSREGEILAALAHGKRVSEIARESFVSEATVRTQVKSILGKLGVNSQIAAVAIARDAGWHPPMKAPAARSSHRRVRSPPLPGSLTLRRAGPRGGTTPEPRTG